MYHFNMLEFYSYMYIVVLFSLSLFLYCLLSFLFLSLLHFAPHLEYDSCWQIHCIEYNWHLISIPSFGSLRIVKESISDSYDTNLNVTPVVFQVYIPHCAFGAWLSIRICVSRRC